MSATALAVLLKVTPRGSNIPIRYQNYRIAPIIFNGESYTFAGFAVQNQPTVDLSLSSGDTQIAMRKTAALDSILRANNDLKRAVVVSHYIQPGATVPPITTKTIVSFVTREGGMAMFTNKSATSALQGNNLTKYISAVDFPELPYYNARL
jgi:hypothetical protein